MAGGMSFAPHVIFFQLTQFHAIQTTIGFGLLLFIACSSFVGNHDDILFKEMLGPPGSRGEIE